MSGAAFGLLLLFAASYALGLAVFCGADLLKIHRSGWRVQASSKGKLHK